MIGEGSWGAALRARIAARGMTRSGLAARMKLTRARVGELCARDTAPRVETVLRLAEALGCRASELDDRLADEALPIPGSRVHAAAKILESRFGLEVESVRTGSGRHYLICRRPGESDPAAIVSGPNAEGNWGCLAEARLQIEVFAALNGHA